MESKFQWECEPKAEKIILDAIIESCKKNSQLEKLGEELLKKTSTRLQDWVDHIVLGQNKKIEEALDEAGFTLDHSAPSYRVFYHPGASLPLVVLKDHDIPVAGVAVKVDFIADFLMVRGLTGWIEGTAFSTLRRTELNCENDVRFWVVERRGGRGVEPTYMESSFTEKYLSFYEKWQTRPRYFESDDAGIEATLELAQELVESLGEALSAEIVLECERKFWQSKNCAGQLQKNRQDTLGMGWANHDHHTFRSSRRYFHKLVRLFEILGFYCRERFYAGQEAGWGAQVMEHKSSKLVLFLDVDLDPHELQIDFAHHQLKELNKLGTIGLWCALHGDSILQSGMHHLEAQFEFDELKNDLGKLGVSMMAPFSHFNHLKQAFTVGERWPVNKQRVDRLLKDKRITDELAKKFLEEGALGSHLENLQRKEGFKGFNQKNVSVIIKKTDPRLC